MLNKLKKSVITKRRYLHKNIEYLMRTFSIDIKSLSLGTGIPIATISRMKKEDNNPTIASIEPIAVFFRVELNDFLYEDLSSVEYQKKKKIGKIHYVKALNLEDFNQWPIEFNSKMYFGTVGNLNENAFGVIINTNSMSPVFFKNTVVIVDPSITPNDSDYVFCKLKNNEVPVLRQIFLDGSDSYFKPINPNYGEMSAETQFEIIGTIVKSIENYR